MFFDMSYRRRHRVDTILGFTPPSANFDLPAGPQNQRGEQPPNLPIGLTVMEIGIYGSLVVASLVVMVGQVLTGVPRRKVETSYPNENPVIP